MESSCRRRKFEFFATWHTGIIPSGGGYPVYDGITFSDGGKKYTVIACGWTSDLDDKKPLHLFGYRE